MCVVRHVSIFMFRMDFDGDGWFLVGYGCSRKDLGWMVDGFVMDSDAFWMDFCWFLKDFD